MGKRSFHVGDEPVEWLPIEGTLRADGDEIEVVAENGDRLRVRSSDFRVDDDGEQWVRRGARVVSYERADRERSCQCAPILPGGGSATVPNHGPQWTNPSCATTCVGVVLLCNNCRYENGHFVEGGSEVCGICFGG